MFDIALLKDSTLVELGHRLNVTVASPVHVWSDILRVSEASLDSAIVWVVQRMMDALVVRLGDAEVLGDEVLENE